MKNKKALSGYKVIDLGQVIAGNFCSALLADFGAEVIKIERPGVGDGIRYMGHDKDGVSTQHMVENRGKKCITLDLKSEKGKEILLRLVKEADVIVENYVPGVMEKLGFSFEELQKVNPKIILARISGYGQYGPKRDFPGYDRVGMAYSGVTYVTGDPEGEPVRPGICIADYTTGLFASYGILLAIINRDSVGTGKGQVVDIGLYESLFRLMESIPTDYKLFGEIRERTGNQHNLTAPGNNYLTKDGKWVGIAIANDRVFERFCKSIDREDLLKEERFSTNLKRTIPENKKELDTICHDWVASHTFEECRVRMETSIPFAPVMSIEDIFKEEHYRVRENIIEIDQDTVGKVYMQGIVPKLSETPGEVKWAGAKLGAFNDEVYKNILGFSNEEIEKFKEEKVI